MRRWVFSLYPSPTLLRLSPFCRGPPAHPATSRVLRSLRLHPALLAHPGAAFPRSDNSARSRSPKRNRNPDRTPDLSPKPNWSRTSAARSRSRPPRPVRQSFRLRLRRQSLHTATIRQPVTSNPITARKAVASPEATAQTRARPPLHAAAPGIHNPSAGPPASAPQPDYTIKGRSSPAIHHNRTTICARRSLPSAVEHGPFLLPRCPSQPSTGLSSSLAAPRSRTRALPSFPSFRLPRLEPGTKKRPHVAVRASVSPKIGRITSRSSRHSP